MERRKVKQHFTKWTQITVDLKEAGIKEVNLANEWQAGLLCGRGYGYTDKNFAWILFKVVYYFSRVTKVWEKRDPLKVFPRDHARGMMDHINRLMYETMNLNRYNFTESLTAMINALVNLRTEVFKIESEMKLISDESVKNAVKTEIAPVQVLPDIKEEVQEAEFDESK